MAIYKRGKVYWYSFIFAGQRIQESSKSSLASARGSAGQSRANQRESKRSSER